MDNFTHEQAHPLTVSASRRDIAADLRRVLHPSVAVAVAVAVAGEDEESSENWGEGRGLGGFLSRPETEPERDCKTRWPPPAEPWLPSDPLTEVKFMDKPSEMY